MPGIPINRDDLTSGQFPPKVTVPFSEFPKEVKGPSVWSAKDYTGSPEKEAKWISRWTPDQIAQIEDAAQRYLDSGRPLTEIEKSHFRLGDKLEAFLANVREDILNGKGFTLFKVYRQPPILPSPN